MVAAFLVKHIEQFLGAGNLLAQLLNFRVVRPQVGREFVPVPLQHFHPLPGAQVIGRTGRDDCGRIEPAARSRVSARAAAGAIGRHQFEHLAFHSEVRLLQREPGEIGTGAVVLFLQHHQAGVALGRQQLVLGDLELFVLLLQLARQGIQRVVRAGRADFLAVGKIFINQRLEERLGEGWFGTGSFQHDDGGPGRLADAKVQRHGFQFRLERGHAVGGARLQLLALEQFDLGPEKELEFLAVKTALRQFDLAAHPQARLGDIRGRLAQHVECHQTECDRGRERRQPPVSPQVTDKTRASGSARRVGLRVGINRVVGILFGYNFCFH